MHFATGHFAAGHFALGYFGASGGPTPAEGRHFAAGYFGDGHFAPGYFAPGYITAPSRRFVVPFAARPVVLAAYRRIVPDKAEPGPPPTTP